MEKEIEVLSWSFSGSPSAGTGAPGFDASVTPGDIEFIIKDAPNPAVAIAVIWPGSNDLHSPIVNPVEVQYTDDGGVVISYVLPDGMNEGSLEIADANLNDIRSGLANLGDESGDLANILEPSSLDIATTDVEALGLAEDTPADGFAVPVGEVGPPTDPVGQDTVAETLTLTYADQGGAEQVEDFDSVSELLAAFRELDRSSVDDSHLSKLILIDPETGPVIEVSVDASWTAQQPGVDIDVSVSNDMNGGVSDGVVTAALVQDDWII